MYLFFDIWARRDSSWICSTLTEFRLRGFAPAGSICSLSGLALRASSVRKSAELPKGILVTLNTKILKKDLKGPFLVSGREETRTLTPKALDPKSSASTNFATRPKACVCEHLLIYQDQNYLSKGIFKYKFYKCKVL